QPISEDQARPVVVGRGDDRLSQPLLFGHAPSSCLFRRRRAGRGLRSVSRRRSGGLVRRRRAIAPLRPPPPRTTAPGGAPAPRSEGRRVAFLALSYAATAAIARDRVGRARTGRGGRSFAILPSSAGSPRRPCRLPLARGPWSPGRCPGL